MGTLSGSGPATRVAHSWYEKPSESHEKVVVDEVVHLDHDDPDAPIRIVRSGGTKSAMLYEDKQQSPKIRFLVNYLGHITARGGLRMPVGGSDEDVGSYVSALKDQQILYFPSVDSNSATIDAATHIDAGLPNLVKRNKTQGCVINNLQVGVDNSKVGFPPAGLYYHTANTDGVGLNLLDNARLLFQPYDANGVEESDRYYTFGRDPAAQDAQDGIFMQDATDPANSRFVRLNVSGSDAMLTMQGASSQTPVIKVQQADGTNVFQVYSGGYISYHGHKDTAGSAHVVHAGDVVTGDTSLYLGSLKYSYDRALHELKLGKLKHQIPAYLVAQGVVAGDLPTTADLMNAHAWCAFARTHLNNDLLDVSTVLSAADFDDYKQKEIRDLETEVGALETWADAAEVDITQNETDIATNATGIVANTNSIVTTNGNVANNATAIAANAVVIGTKEDALSYGLVTETGKVCLSQNIKSYVDSSGGGFTFQGDSNDSWLFEPNPLPTVDVDDWYMLPDEFGTRTRISYKMNLTGNGWRSIIMKFSSGHLAHAVFDCDFHYIETPTNTLDAGNRDAFYGGHTRYSVSMTDGKSFTVFNGSWDEDCLVIRFNCQLDSSSNGLDTSLYMNVRVHPVNSRFYHQ